MAIDILLVCTANMCRSPMAEGLLRHRLATVPEEVHVHSAGLLTEGEAPTPDAVAVLRARGIDISGHRSRRISPDLLGPTDLVVGMTRHHVAEVSVLVPDAWSRSFTLKELVRRGTEAGRRKPDQPLAAWLADVQWGRQRTDLLGRSPEDDVADPIGRPRSHYQRTATELDGLLGRVVDLIWAGQP